MKLGRFAILMIGIMIFVSASAWGYFLYYMPNMKEVGMLNENKALNDAEAAKMPQAKKRVALAMKMVDEKAAEWQKIVATRTPPTDLAHGGISLGDSDVPVHRRRRLDPAVGGGSRRHVRLPRAARRHPA